MATASGSPRALMLCRKKRFNRAFQPFWDHLVTTRQDGAGGVGRGIQAMRREPPHGIFIALCWERYHA
jgi:hypothetical protein